MMNGYHPWVYSRLVILIAPEILKGESYSYSVDWFSLGVILFEMISGVVCLFFP